MFYVSVFPLNSQNSILDFPNNNNHNKNYTKQVSNEFAERRSKKVAKLHFACQIRGPHCLYSKTCFTMRTRNPKTWIHLMFLDFQVRHYVSIPSLFIFYERKQVYNISIISLQVKEKSVLSTREPGISNLKNIWQILKCENRSFTELVTSQFPSIKVSTLVGKQTNYKTIISCTSGHRE